MALGAAKGLVCCPLSFQHGTKDNGLIYCSPALQLYLHRQKPPIMHRDMKSLNILVDENFHVKLADFGLSFDKNNNLNTRMGTLNWVAPEILEGSTVYDEKADIYSFGLVLWEILTGKTPFEVRISSLFELMDF
jgi:serine/threonine protein kinase